MEKYDVFTPNNIVLQMQAYLPKKGRLLEPSVGEGALITGLKGPIDVYDISTTYMDKIPNTRNITKKVSNFLTTPVSQTYMRIISNPPFQKYQDIPEDTRHAIRSLHPCLSSGNIDLYVAFLVKCILLLQDGGTYVVICPSTWLFNVSCRAFREFVYNGQYCQHIHDFGSTKVFPGIDVYCAITVFTKTPKTHFTYNERRIDYKNTLSPLSMIQLDTCAATLGSIASIQNGIATLCDKVFIHTQKLYNEPCWKLVFKVSKQKEMWAIVPYTPEDTFKRENPNTYTFLEQFKTDLANRDKGKKIYEPWYSYGRKQGLSIPDIPESIYISTLCNPDISKSIVIQETHLFYSGIRITPKQGISCSTIRDILIKTNLSDRCSKRSNGWLNVTVSVLKSITIV